ncbi:MAG: plasmid recombination protein [Lachnospiraceae bacterium]|nr:plasmid recombination protein [Lachnospiraceae bacterium]
MYGILRANKIKLTSVTKRFQKHIQRQSNYYHSNPDIDISKQNEDVILIFSEDFRKSIFTELENHNITKQPRKNAVGLIDGVITASPAFFDKNSIVDFVKNALPIFQNPEGNFKLSAKDVMRNR